MTTKKKSINKSSKLAKDRKSAINVLTTNDRKDRVTYYANREGESITTFVERAIDERISRLNGDFDVPNITVSRIDQLAENSELMRAEMKLLRQSINNGFGAILKLSQYDD